ncbi:hypothetical protein BDV59DRAFT_164472 [Aspergillus ambiguus]|uniref:uncharacterized protein n=1 Tax=Aspergillus ambiguus TaxID=176160 RepID=UPI003CCD192E
MAQCVVARMILFCTSLIKFGLWIIASPLRSSLKCCHSRNIFLEAWTHSSRWDSRRSGRPASHPKGFRCLHNIHPYKYILVYSPTCMVSSHSTVQNPACIRPAHSSSKLCIEIK